MLSVEKMIEKVLIDEELTPWTGPGAPAGERLENAIGVQA
jgi:hypothetical protein